MERQARGMTHSNNRSVLYESADGVATITLNRPHVLNAMNLKLMHELDSALQNAATDPSVRVMVLTGAGRGFCAGADLSGLAASFSEGSGSSATRSEMNTGDAAAATMDDVYHPAIRRLSSMPIPTIARLNGVVAGGGLGLALGCDIAIAALSASLVCTFTPRLGVVPDLGTSWHLPRRTGRARALGIALLGDKISADQALEWGLIWQAVPDDDLDRAVSEVVRRLGRSSADAILRCRALIDDAPARSLSGQLDAEMEQQRYLIPRNMVAAAEAFVAKMEPEFDR